MSWFFKIIQFLKGALYYRFAIFVCLLGGSFLAPQMWEGALWLLTRIINKVYQTGSVENYEMQNFAPEPQDYIIGMLIIVIGIILFIYFYRQQSKRKNENDDYLALSKLWVNLRDIFDVNPNIDDLKIALSTVNVTSTVLLETSESTISRFRQEWLKDFNNLTYKLSNNNYNIDGENSKDLLNNNVKRAKILLNGTE